MYHRHHPHHLFSTPHFFIFFLPSFHFSINIIHKQKTSPQNLSHRLSPKNHPTWKQYHLFIFIFPTLNNSYSTYRRINFTYRNFNHHTFFIQCFFSFSCCFLLFPLTETFYRFQSKIDRVTFKKLFQVGTTRYLGWLRPKVLKKVVSFYLA